LTSMADDTPAFYFDEMLVRASAEQLVKRGINVVMAIDVDMVGKDDDTEHLTYAITNNLVVVTFDRAFAGRTMSRSDHSGLICFSGAQDDIGGIVRALIGFVQQNTRETVAGRVFWIKLD